MNCRGQERSQSSFKLSEIDQAGDLLKIVACHGWEKDSQASHVPGEFCGRRQCCKEKYRSQM